MGCANCGTFASCIEKLETNGSHVVKQCPNYVAIGTLKVVFRGLNLKIQRMRNSEIDSPIDPERLLILLHGIMLPEIKERTLAEFNESYTTKVHGFRLIR